MYDSRRPELSTPYLRKVIIILTRGIMSLAAIISLLLVGCGDKKAQSFWVWKASDLELVPEQAQAYFYQGDYLLSEQTVFIKRGVSPSKQYLAYQPILLVRVYAIDNPQMLSKQLLYLVEQWQHQGVEIDEIQLDYDSPSSQLVEYRDFLRQLKINLKVNSNITISITGLLTWLADNPKDLRALAQEIKYIHFQFYDRYKPLEQALKFSRLLKDFDAPFKVGITLAEEFNYFEIPRNDFYQGTTIFLNR